MKIHEVELEVYDSGSGEPVLFTHGAIRDHCYPILEEPALADNFRLIHFHRRGFGDLDLPEGSQMTFAEWTSDGKSILRHLAVERAHILGESAGGSFALQFAVDYPESAHSVAVMEPALMTILETSAEFRETVPSLIAAYQSGDKRGALDGFFRLVVGEDYRPSLDAGFPDGWFERWVDDADVLFQYLGGSWDFTQEDAARITQPVINIVGADSKEFWHMVHDTLRTWIPHAENVVLPDTTHVMLAVDPKGVAKTLADFFSRHPIGDRDTTGDARTREEQSVSDSDSQ